MFMVCEFGSIAPHKIVIKRQQPDDTIDFQFPNTNFLKIQFKSFQQIWKQLLRLGMKAFFNAGKVYNKYKFNHKNKIYVYFKCTDRQCQAILQYQQDCQTQSKVKLTVFNNLHIHKKSYDLQKAKREDINQFILSLDQRTMDEFIPTKKWMNKFDLTGDRSLFVIEKLMWQYNTEEQIFVRLVMNEQVKLRRLRSQGADGRTQVIFLSNQSMIDSFKIYGDVVSIGFSDRVLCHYSSFGCRFIVGSFFVHDENMRLLIVGSFVMMRQTQENYEKLFQFFYECTCNNQDSIQVFISDSLPMLNNAVDKFKKQKNLHFVFLNDWLHVVENQLKPKLLHLEKGQQVLQLLVKAFTEKNVNTYEQILQLAKTKLNDNDKQIIDNFKKNAHRYCISKMPYKFQSYAMASNFVEEVNIRTNQMPIYKNHTGRFFYQILFVQRNLVKESKSKANAVTISSIQHTADQFFYLRLKIEKKILQFLLKKYWSSRYFTETQINPIKYKIMHEEKDQSAIVTFSLRYNHWECECNELYFTGLPCEHLLRIITHMKGSLLYYINSRWYHNKENLIFGRLEKGAHISLRTRRRR